jgi:hypothetical protein
VLYAQLDQLKQLQQANVLASYSDPRLLRWICNHSALETPPANCADRAVSAPAVQVRTQTRDAGIGSGRGTSRASFNTA